MYTRKLNKINFQDIKEAGGKGASLGEMARTGFPVPPGFVVVAGAFERFLAETDLNVEVDAILKKVSYKDINSVDKASNQIRDLIADAPFPKDMGKEIVKEYRELFKIKLPYLNPPLAKGRRKSARENLVAVRSSATAEDSTVASWAGELESYLNIGEAGLLEAVKKCWSSLFTPRAIFYRFEKNLHEQKVLVAVVVQAMVQSEVAGIVFTAHPVTEDRNQMVIEAGWGLGEAIVGGLITPDTYVIDKSKVKSQKSKSNSIIDKNISEQAMMIIRQGSGTAKVAVNKEKQGEQKLADGKIIELAKICQKIETHYNFPQDIEWALEKGKFYITQSRPITTLKDKGAVNNISNQPKKVLIELLHVDYPLATAELTDYGETIENLPWSGEKFKFKPYCVFERKNNLFYYYYDPSGIEWKKQQAGQFNKEILKKKIREAYADIRSIVLKEKALSKGEFKDFIDKLKADDTWWDCMWWMIEYYDEKKLEMKDLLRVRKETEYLSPGIAASIRNSVGKIMPAAKKYADVLLIEEIIKGTIPPIKVLKERMKECVYAEGKLFKSIAEVEKQFNIKIQRGAAANYNGELIGQVAYAGEAKGRVRIINSRKELKNFLKDEILVASTTTPDFLPAMKKAAAIISEHGGAICHAAIVARELKKPCIVGVKFATQVLKDGDWVEVDADKGVVRLCRKATVDK